MSGGEEIEEKDLKEEDLEENDLEKKTKTKSFSLIPEKGIFPSLGLQLRDTFQITYDPATKKLRSVKVSHDVEDPQGYSFFEYGSYQGKKKSAKKWIYTTIWYVNVDLVPDFVFNYMSSLHPEIASFKGQGRVLKIKCSYTLKGTGSIKQTKVKLTPMVSENLQEEAKKLINIYQSWAEKE